DVGRAALLRDEEVRTLRPGRIPRRDTDWLRNLSARAVPAAARVGGTVVQRDALDGNEGWRALRGDGGTRGAGGGCAGVFSDGALDQARRDDSAFQQAELFRFSVVAAAPVDAQTAETALPLTPSPIWFYLQPNARPRHPGPLRLFPFPQRRARDHCALRRHAR